MGFFALLFDWKGEDGGAASKNLRSRAVIEPLERRVLFDVQVNSPAFDAPGPAGPAVNIYSEQMETTNATFSPPGSNDHVVVAYNDGAMQQYGQAANGSPAHLAGWSYSSNGGLSFNQASNDPNNPPVLPLVPNESSSSGDGANSSLAWDNADATLYLASTSDQPKGEINVHASADGGQTFPVAMDATPGAPTGAPNYATYDKPWLAADNYLGTGDGAGYGTLYLAYVQNLGAGNQIVITDLPQNGTSWPTSTGGNPPGFVLAGPGILQAPQVLVEPDHSVDVVYAGQGSNGWGIWLDHSDSPTQRWSESPIQLDQLNGGLKANLDARDVNGDGHTTMTGINQIPSAALAQINGQTFLYVAYTEINSPAFTVSVHVLVRNLSTGTTLSDSAIGQISGVLDQFNPALTVSPDGSYLFVGFYGGKGVYDPNSGTANEVYNAYCVTRPINSTGNSVGDIDWTDPTFTQVTNLNSSGQPTGATFDQPGGPNSEEYLGDYDSASADNQYFHYSFTETYDEQVTDSGGNQVTLHDQTDVHMANVPIPYAGATPATPSALNVAPDSIGSGTLTVTWNGTPYTSPNTEAYVEYSTAGQGWLLFAQPIPASVGTLTYTIPNYSANTPYYFRVRVKNLPTSDNSNADASSAWSTVVQSWTGATYTPDLWYYVAGTFTDGKIVHTLYNFDFAYPSDSSNQPIYGDLQWWDYSNQRWDQVDHILLDSAGGLTYYFDPIAASGQSVQITSSDQFRIRFDNSSGGSTAWLQLYPNEGTPYDADQPEGYSAVLSTDDQGNHTLTVSWADEGYTQADIMVISITSNGSEWWDPVNQRVIWEVLGATDSNPDGTLYAFEESATFTNVPDDGVLTVQFQISFTDTGKLSDPVTVQV